MTRIEWMGTDNRTRLVAFRALLAIALAWAGTAGAFEQDQRINSFTQQFGTNSFATANAFGGAFASVAQSQLQTAINSNIADGSVSILFEMRRLADLTGTSVPSLQMGVVNGAPMLNTNNPINDNVGRVPPEAMPQLQKLARLAGARFVLRELAHEKKVTPGAALHLEMKWANVGAGKLYHPYVLRFSLLDTEGRVCFTSDAKADPRQWLPGEYAVVEALQLPATLKAAEYTLAVALVDPTGQRRPFQLAIDAPRDGDRYFVSHLDIY